MDTAVASDSEVDAFCDDMELQLIQGLLKPFHNKKGKIVKSKDRFKPRISSLKICKKAKLLYDLIRKSKEEGASQARSHSKFCANQTWYLHFRARALKDNLQLPLYETIQSGSPFADKLTSLLASGQYRKEQIWIGAHFGMFYKRMPDGSTLANSDDSKRGRKKNRNHLTLLLTANIAEDFNRHFQLKPLVCHPEGENSKWEKEVDTNRIILASDKPKARLTKSIMLQWLRVNFYDEVHDYYSKLTDLKDKPFQAILLLSDCFAEYFVDELVHPSIKLLFFPHGEVEQLGVVFDITSSVAEPFIANYMRMQLGNLLLKREMMPDKSVEDLWREYDINNACELMIRLVGDNFMNHLGSIRAKFCPICSPYLNYSEDFPTTSSQQKYCQNAGKCNTILEIVQQAARLELDVDIASVLELIECNIDELGDDVITERLNGNENTTTDGGDTGHTALPQSTPATPLKTPAKPPKASRKSLSLEKAAPQKRIQRDTIDSGLELLKEAADILKGNFPSVADEQIVQAIIQKLEEKAAQVKEELRFSSSQATLITKYFSVQNHQSAASTFNSSPSNKSFKEY